MTEGKLSPSKAFSMQGEQIQGPPDGTPGGEGRDNEALTQSDAAAICAGGMPARCYLAARVKYTHDYSSAGPLERMLWVEAAGIAHRERWIVAIGQTTLRSISELAVAELLEPARYRTEAAKVAWFGQNVVKLNPDRVWPVWTRTWRSRYSVLYALLELWAGQAEGHVMRRQREENGSEES